jgi:hypothetical protein
MIHPSIVREVVMTQEPARAHQIATATTPEIPAALSKTTFSYGPEEQSIADLSKFCILKSSEGARKVYQLDETFTVATLSSIVSLGKPLHLIILKHSSAISTNPVFKNCTRELFSPTQVDRSGTSSNALHNALVIVCTNHRLLD